MATVDLNVLVSGFLRHAARQPNSRTWLESMHASAVAAVAAGDRFVTSTGFDGANSTMERRFEAKQVLEVTEICLSRLDAEAAGDDDSTSGHVRAADFSGRRSEWG
jgi:hypothetical protein